MAPNRLAMQGWRQPSGRRTQAKQRSGAILADDKWRSLVMIGRTFIAAVVGVSVSGSISAAETLTTHRLPSALAVEAASETVAVCAKQGFHETAVVVDADGVTIVALRGDG